MKRRNFMRVALGGIGSGILVPQWVMAESVTPAAPSMAGGVFFTKDAPGRWAKKIDGHLPSIELAKGADALAVRVTTGHEMNGYEHYIVKHVLLDKNYAFIDEHMFDPTQDSVAISTFNLKDYSGPLYALSVCNKHDAWLNMVEV